MVPVLLGLSRAGFLNLATLDTSCPSFHAVLFRVLRSIPGFHPLDTSSLLTLNMTTKNVSRHFQASPL